MNPYNKREGLAGLLDTILAGGETESVAAPIF